MFFSPKESGQGLVEYALIFAMVVIITWIAILLLGPTIGNVLSKINSSLPKF